MSKLARICLIGLISISIIVPAFGQSLEERLQSMAAKNAESYITPVVTAFGSALNSGWFYSAKPHKLLGFDIGVKGMGVMFPTNQKTFTFDISDLNSYNFSTSINGYTINLTAEDLYPNHEVPTFLGDNEAVDVRADKDQIVDLIEGQLLDQGISEALLSSISGDINNAADNALNVVPSLPIAGSGLEIFPMAVPQVAIGLSIPMTPIKAEIVARYFPELEISKEIGKLSFVGGGGRLALDSFIPIPMFPINITAGAFWQQLKVGDIFESTNMLYSLQAGKNLNLLVFGLGVYGAIGMESTTVDINYTYLNNKDVDDPLNGTTIGFDLKGENKMRYSVGGFFRLAIFNLSAEYAMGADNVLTAGLAIAIR